MMNISKILQLSLVKNTLKLSSSSALLMFLPLLVTPILSRLYTPEDYGDWGVFSSVFYIINSFLFLSYENTIVKSNRKEDVPVLLGLCAIVASIIILLTIVVFSLGKLLNISFFDNYPSLTLLVTLLSAQAIHTLANNVANREKKYGLMSISNVIGGISQASLRIALGMYPLVSYGLIIGNVFAQIITTLFIVVGLIYSISIYWKEVTFSKIKEQATSNWKFPLFDAPARFVELSLSNFALIIMTFFWDKSRIGCYSMVTQFIILPISIVGSAMGSVFYRELSENIDNKEIITKTTRNACRISFFLSFLPLVFFVLGGDYLLALVLGSKWEASGTMALCLCIYSVPLILSEPLLPVFRSLDRQEIRFKLNLISFVCSLGALLIAAYITKNLYFSIIIYSLFSGFVRYLMFFSIIRLTQVHISSISKYFIHLSIFFYVLLIVKLCVKYYINI